MKAPSTRPAAVLGLDVGKSSHWACLIDRDGEVLDSAPVRNREAELDALFASAPAGTLVVVDQFRNIGSLAVRRARAAGLGVAHLPGLAASRAAGLFAGEAKTDERDAAVIARTALGVPDSLSGVPGRGEALEAAACSPCPASARGPRRSSRCRSTSGGSRTTTTWPRTAA